MTRPRITRLLLAPLVVLSLFASLAVATPSSADISPRAPELFRVASPVGAVWGRVPLGPDEVLRTAYVTVDTSAFRAAAERYEAGSPSVLRATMFGDTVVDLHANRTTVEPGHVVWSGPVFRGGAWAGAAIASLWDDSFHANVFVDGHHYVVETVSPAGLHAIYEVGKTAGVDGMLGGPSLTVDGEAEPRPIQPIAASGGAVPIVDVLVVFTAAARAVAPNIEQVVRHAVDYTNEAYAGSAVNQAVRLVGLREVPFGENPMDIDDDLRILRQRNDNELDEVHGWRNELGADAVSLWAAAYHQYPTANGRHPCGRGFIMSTVTWDFQPSAVSVQDIYCNSDRTLAHELGHNMSARHDRGDDNVDGQPHNYNHGHVVGDGNASTRMDGDFQTIMGVSCAGCTRIPRFSNPDIFWNMHPTGVRDIGLGGAADNRRTLIETSRTTETFRDSRIGLLNACSEAYVKQGALSAGNHFQQPCGSRYVAVNGNRIAVITSCGSLVVSDSRVDSRAFVTVLPCGDAQSVVLADDRIGVINGCGAAYVKEGALTSPWHLQVGCGQASKLALGGDRIGLITSCGEAWVKESPLTTPGQYQQQTGCNDALAIAVSRNRVAIIAGCSGIWVEEGPLNHDYSQQVQCGQARALALTNDRLGVINDCGAAFVKAGPLTANWHAQLECGDAGALVLAGNRVGVITSAGGAHVKEGAVTSGFTPVSSNGDARQISLYGSS